MTAAILTIVICPLVQYGPLRDDGEIYGVVLNATHDDTPAGNVAVMLRVTANGQFELVAETKADAQGRYRFEKLPVGGEFHYLPGANRGGVHYPGPRIQLTPHSRRARVALRIHETQSHPNPLVARQHVIRIQPERGAVRVTESIRIDNPTSKTYVGRASDSGETPVTLSLAIPPNFDRTTFDKEFFGRRFSLDGQKLVTSVPWTPGEKELAFTYVVPNETRHVMWQRPLDLPCSDVRVYVTADRPEEIRCNLGKSDSGQNTGELLFASRGLLEPGHVVRLEIGDVPLPWSAHARWVAGALLVGLVVVTGVLTLRRRKHSTKPPAAFTAGSSSSPSGRSRKRRRSRSGRRQSVSH